MTNSFKDNQGVINGRITRLSGRPDKLAEYALTLTPAQREIARNHLKTVLRVKNAKNNENISR